MRPRPRPAHLAAVKPKGEEKSPDSLEGHVFNHITRHARLENADARRYEQIFALQAGGNFSEANVQIRKLGDDRLMGHVLAQRFRSPAYQPTYKELADWMKYYADHPGAQRIYDLAVKHKPKRDAAPLAAPQPGHGLVGYHDYDSGQLAQPYSADEKEVKEDAKRARAAASYLYNNKLDDAYREAAASSDRSGDDIPLAGWVAGLAAWKGGDYAEAARHFERTATSPRASAWVRAAGSYWAARAYLRSHRPEKVSYWLQRAADSPRSFYGIIAVKALGLEQQRFNWSMPALTEGAAAALAQTPAGRRALALMDAHQDSIAEQEIRQIDPGENKKLQEAMMAFAHDAGEPDFEMRLGSGIKDKHGRLYDGALYPDAPWPPAGGYKVDKALVHAFIRQESKFDHEAENGSSGATGLMQMLPSTAKLLGARQPEKELRDPAANIALGQKYLERLLQESYIRGNLFKLAVAYNAGPGKLSRWEKTLDYDKDPLLFVETIPVAETRLFVERVMTNYWIYRIKYKQSLHSLDMVASGEWPMYIAQDPGKRGK